MRRALRTLWVCAIVLGLWALEASAGGGEVHEPSASLSEVLLYALAWFMPLGIALVATGIGEPGRAQQVATSLPLALVAALGGYLLCGFAFQFGGVGLLVDSPGLAPFIAEWSPLDLALGPGWGLVGLRGFALSAEVRSEEALRLLLFELPLVTTAALIPLLASSGQVPRLPGFFLALLASGLCYPLLGNWLRGGGWLAQLGQTLHLGHGFVDYGLSSLHLLGGGMALAALLAFKWRTVPEAQRPELPPSHLPLNVLVGAFLALIGWLVVILSQPLVPSPASAAWLILKALVAVAASSLSTLFYGWLVRGAPDAGLTGRGLLATLVAVSAPLPFVPLWAVALIGGLTGLALAPAMYLVQHVVGLDDRGAVLSVHGLAGLGGLVAVGLFADGDVGAGWNLPLDQAARLSQGVTGYLLAGDRAQGLGQLYAQFIGVGAILILSLLLPWALLSLVAQAYALPSAMRARARARAAKLRQRREALERLKRLGGGLGFGPKARAAYLRLVAASPRRLMGRRRLVRPGGGSSLPQRLGPPRPRVGARRLVRHPSGARKSSL